MHAPASCTPIPYWVFPWIKVEPSLFGSGSFTLTSLQRKVRIFLVSKKTLGGGCTKQLILRGVSTQEHTLIPSSPCSANHGGLTVGTWCLIHDLRTCLVPTATDGPEILQSAPQTFPFEEYDPHQNMYFTLTHRLRSAVSFVGHPIPGSRDPFLSST